MPTEIGQLLNQIVSSDIHFGYSVISDREIGLFECERPLIAHATSIRRREFAAGRRSARRALAFAGASKSAIPAGPDRLPVWPDGFIGSITHTRDVAAAVVTRTSKNAAVGLDVETIARVSPALTEAIATVEECRFLESSNAPSVSLALIFSAKEAWYKCQYHLTKSLFTFSDVEVSLDFGTQSFEVRPRPARATRLAPSLAGAFAIGGTYVASLVAFRVRQDDSDWPHDP